MSGLLGGCLEGGSRGIRVSFAARDSLLLISSRE